jgi:hypothetical protein
MIRTIRLTFTDVHEADALLPVDDDRGWPSDVEGGKSKMVIDAVALDHRAVWID